MGSSGKQGLSLSKQYKCFAENPLFDYRYDAHEKLWILPGELVQGTIGSKAQATWCFVTIFNGISNMIRKPAANGQ